MPGHESNRSSKKNQSSWSLTTYVNGIISFSAIMSLIGLGRGALFEAAEEPRNERRALLDIGNTSAIIKATQASNYLLADAAYGIDIQGDYAFIAANSLLAKMNINDPNNMRLDSQFNPANPIQQVSVDPTTLLTYMAGPSSPVLDIVDGLQMVRVGQYTHLAPIAKLAVAGSGIFLSNHNQPSFSALTTGANPSEIVGTNYTTGRGVTKIFPIGDDVLVTYPGYGTTRVKADSFPKVRDIPLAGMIHDTAVTGAYCLAAGSNGLYIINKSSPSNPRVEGHLALPGTATSVMAVGNRAYVTAGSAFYIVDFTDPVNPSIVSSHTTQGPANSIFVHGTTLYVGNGNRMDLFDITNENAISPIASFDAQGTVEDIVIDDLGQIAYLACGDQGIKLVSIKDNQPGLLSQISRGGYTKALAVNGALLCTADGDKGAALIGVSDPNKPRVLDEYPTANALSVFILNNAIYLGDAVAGLMLFDTFKFSRFAFVASFGTSNNAQGVSVANGFAFVGGDTPTLQMIEAPIWQRRIPNPATAMQVAANPTHTFVATFEQELHIFDQADKAVAVYRLAGFARDMLVYGNYVVVSEGDRGIEFINIKDPANPAHAGQYTNNITYARGLAQKGNHLYVTDDSGLVSALRLNAQPLITSNQMIIYAGQTKVVTIDNLMAVDDDNPSSERVFTVTPNGNCFFQHKDFQGRAITTFTLQQVERGEIQIVHQGTLPPDYQVMVSDGSLSDGPYSPLIFFNEPPVWLANQLTIKQGEHVPITLAHLDAELIGNLNIPYNLASVEYQVTQQSPEGHFAFANAPNVPIDAFTKLDVVRGEIIFVHRNGETKPNVRIALSNGAITLPAIEFNITFINLNNPPVFEENCIDVNQNQATTVTPNQLRASDVDDDDSLLQFEVDRMQHARFTLSLLENSISTRFNQSHIAGKLLQYIHRGGTNDTPSYWIRVSDGKNGTQFQRGCVRFNAEPIVDINSLAIEQNERKPFTTDYLLARDPDGDDNDLSYFFGARNGFFDLQGVPQTNFTHRQLTGGEIWVNQDDSNQALTYWVMVQDPRGARVNRTADVTFNAEDIVDHTWVIVGSGVGGSLLLIALVAALCKGGKHNHDQNTRKKHQLARYYRHELKLNEYENFNTKKGAAFVKMVNTGLTTELKRKGINPNNVADDDLQNLARQLASATDVVFPNQKKSTFLFWSNGSSLTTEQISPKIQEIVQNMLTSKQNPLTGGDELTFVSLEEQSTEQGSGWGTMNYSSNGAGDGV